jgi:FKBP-type peptidyl-prolyl cis-trans isomerase
MATEHLRIELLQAGTGPAVESGGVVTVHYTGWLENGSKFDSSKDRNEPFQVAAGVGQVIGGWDQALLRLRGGDKARLTIPPHLAYGAQGIPPIIPANATLIFEIEVLEVGG